MLVLRCAFAATLALASGAHGQVQVQPDDPDLRYRGFVNATIDSTRARFDRLSIAAPANLNSPGVRVDFVSDAQQIAVKVDYLLTSDITPGVGLFRLEVDGVLRPTLIGSDTDLGVQVYSLFSQATPAPHTFSLIWPYGSDVDLLELELTGGSPGLLGPPPASPAFMHVAHGDSIVQGFDSTNVAAGYPYLVGAAEGWSTTNMGFYGHNVDAADGTVLGGLGGDLVTLDIGVNDWFYSTSAVAFTSAYEGLLDNLRALQPNVRVIALTPSWTDRDGFLNAEGLIVDDYRQLIRDVVLPRANFDPELYLMEGSLLAPPSSGSFPDGLHPNDSGFAFFASALSDPNLVVEPGFEIDGYAWTNLGGAVIESTQPNTGNAALRLGPGPGAIEQPLGRVLRGEQYQLSAWAHVDMAGASGTVAVLFCDDQGVELDRAELVITALSYAEHRRVVSAPAQFAQAKLQCSQAGGSGFFWVDDIELLGIDDVEPSVYCTAKTNSLGCVPTVYFEGAPSATLDQPFNILASQVRNQLNGLLFYGFGSAKITPFNGGTLCVQPPLRRLSIQAAGGSPPPTKDCSGIYAFAFNAYAQSGGDPQLVPGQRVNAQWWSRDPQHPDGTGVGLTDALEFLIGN